MRVGSKEKIKKIVQTFYELIAEKGYHNASIRDITEKANVTISTIYHYFPGGKLEIMKKVYDFFSDQIFELSSFDGEFSIINLDEFVKRFVTTHRNNYSIHKAIDEAMLSHPELNETLQDSSKHFFTKIVQQLRASMKYFAKIPEDELLSSFMLIYNTLEAYIHRHLFFEPIFKNDEELINFLIKLLKNFITTNFEIIH